MERDKDKELDKFFKDAMKDHDQHIDYREHDWEQMEQMLNQGTRRPAVMWYSMVAGIAALLLVAIGVWYTISSKNDDQEVKVIVKQKPSAQKTDSVTTGDDDWIDNQKEIKPVIKQQSNSITGLPARIGDTAGRGSNTPRPVLTIVDTAALAVTGKASPADKIQNDQADDVLGGSDSAANASKAGVLANADDLPKDSDKSRQEDITDTKATIPGGKFRPALAISVITSTDVNGVSSFNNGKVGTNGGLLLSLRLNSKWTVTTGAVYAYKPYATSFDKYHTSYQFAVQPENVMADCRVLDIPINIDYRFYSKKRNSFSAGAGLSSWFMLNEKYTFNYPGNYQGPSSYTVSNQNRHILGVLNLQVTYQRQLNSRFGIAVQPFLKVPLTNIGYSQVRLQSVGLTGGIVWNVSP